MRIGLVGSTPSHNRGGPFKMSDFPALDGRVSAISMNSTPREAQMSQESIANFPSALRTDGTVREESLSQSASAQITEQMAKDDVLSRQIAPQLNTGTFAMQSEDFPALPGSQTPHQNAIFCEPDGIEASKNSPAVTENFDGATPSALKCGGNVLGMQFPIIGHGDLPPQHLMPLHSTTGSEPNLFKLTEASDVNRGSNISLKSATQPHHYARQSAESIMHGCVDSANSETEMTILHKTHGRNECTSTIEHSQTNPCLPTPGPTAGDSTPKANMLPENNEIENQTKFGLLGLLDVIRMTNADLNTLALGSDLTTLGLNLNSSECLYSTFASPWAEAPTMREPQFSLPMCYYMQPPPLKTSHLSKFQLETLFYIFYAMPKDVLQAYSAQELYNREWQYHQDMKLWFKRGSASDGLSVSTNQYIFFDINSWECRLFSNSHSGNMQRNNISAGLLPEDEVRVKFTTTQ